PRPSARKTHNKSTCQICNQVESRYTCSACFVPYCSVVCFKNHKSSSEGPGHGCTGTKTAADESSSAKSSLAATLEIIHSTRHYEAIGMPLFLFPLPRCAQSPFHAFSHRGHPDLPNTALRNLLISIDKLSGVERERALQRALGVGDGRIDIGFGESTHPHSHSQPEVSEDVLGLRALAEAIEGAVRDKDGKDGKGTLGLDWDSL
ncbi:hypothetical protein BDP27DRAFT_1348318, partial [Rhodocollybia butyracea]